MEINNIQKEPMNIIFSLNFDGYKTGYKTDWSINNNQPNTPLHKKLPFDLHPQYVNEFYQFFEPSNFYRNVVTLCSKIENHNKHKYYALLDSLVENATNHSSHQDGALFVKYNYTLKRKDYSLAPGWVSAIGNAFVIRGLARIYEETKSQQIADLNKKYAKAFLNFHYKERNNAGRWFSWISDDGYLWFDEYPGDDGIPSLVLNGHIHSLYGLYYYLKTIDCKHEREMFYPLLLAGLTTLKHNTLKFRRYQKINSYSLREKNKNDYLPDRTLRQQKELYSLTGDPVFKTNFNLFKKDFDYYFSKNNI